MPDLNLARNGHGLKWNFLFSGKAALTKSKNLQKGMLKLKELGVHSVVHKKVAVITQQLYIRNGRRLWINGPVELRI